MLNVTAKNLDELWKRVNWTLWGFTDADFDFQRPGVTAHSFHNQFYSETAELTRSITAFGYSKTKWSMLLRLYFDPESYRLLIARLKHYRGEVRGKRYVVDIPLMFKQRDNASGQCLLGMTFRFSQKHGWGVEVFTRASESVSRWGVDLVFIHVLIREVGKHFDFVPKDVHVFWNSASMFQSILTTPLFLAAMGEKGLKELKKPDPLSKWQAAVQKRFRGAFDTEHRKYKSYKSQRRAVDAFDVLQGDMPPKLILPVEDLWLPVVDLTMRTDFFKKGGFK